ncbi:MAG TPA: FIST N-terminal domain-containing protein [Chitinophagaceae bacterium]|nr:FIST C-terminal domain-containing protein [Chitinophagaceae bacterium]MCB9054492.1 FIST C-terminal domain-containing protein [Chitinophagales bacterium]HPG11178.1 FIST N-terminal domain-containing protein [Chitinophagaceae bacterium]HRX93945.1 FIST N-terminal domain-containing protein [Chitinophagaceae bacterium]
MKAKTIKGKSIEDIETVIVESMADGYKPTLAIVFMSFKLDINAVCELLDQHKIQVFGATSSGEFINNDIGEESIVIMLLDIPPAYFKLTFFEAVDKDDFNVAKQLGEEGRNTFTNAAFIIASGWVNDIDGEEIIRGIETGYGSNAIIFGGMAGDDQTLTGPMVFTKGKRSTTGLLGLIIDHDKVDITGVATCGWKPIGITKIITKSEGNIVYTIDDQPALDLVMKYLGLSLSDEPMNNTVFSLGAYYPLQMERENAPSVMRTAMLGNTADRSLVCAGKIPQGSRVRFSLPPDFDVIDTVVNDCNQVKEEELQQADAVIVFSCISRYLSFGVMTREELERVSEVWNAPMAGFFSYGEYGKSITAGQAGNKGQHEFHNNTCCVVALKEK